MPAAWFALWALFEYGNFSCHATLRNMKLRSGGAKSVPAPDPDYVLSRAFELVSCPNYLYEVRIHIHKRELPDVVKGDQSPRFLYSVDISFGSSLSSLGSS